MKKAHKELEFNLRYWIRKQSWYFSRDLYKIDINDNQLVYRFRIKLSDKLEQVK
jgi:hypothetical protein